MCAYRHTVVSARRLGATAGPANEPPRAATPGSLRLDPPPRLPLQTCLVRVPVSDAVRDLPVTNSSTSEAERDLLMASCTMWIVCVLLMDPIIVELPLQAGAAHPGAGDPKPTQPSGLRTRHNPVHGRGEGQGVGEEGGRRAGDTAAKDTGLETD